MFLHYLEKHEHKPWKLSFQACCIPCLENDTALVCYYLIDVHQPTVTFLPERDYVTLGSLLSPIRLSVVCPSVVCNVGAPYSGG